MNLRREIGPQMEKIFGSGKCLASGSFVDDRGGFFLFEVSSSEEIFDLLGAAFIDSCELETHPVQSFENLAKFFQQVAGA